MTDRLHTEPPSGQLSPALRLVQPFPDPIPGILPFGTLTVLAGAPGVGKTTMLADWIARWRSGRSICGKPTNPATAYYILAADRQWKSHQLWFDAVGYPDIPHYSIADDITFSLAKLKSAQRVEECLLYCLDKLKPIPGSHLFIDPVSPLFIAGDPNRARDVATSLLWFSRKAQELQINITVTAHFGKQKGDPKEQDVRPQDRIAGSGAFSGFSDTQIYLIDPNLPKEPYHVLGWVPRHGIPEEFHFKRDDKTGLFVPFEHYTEMDREAAVLACVSYEPLATEAILTHICAGTSFSKRTAERYLQQLVKSGQVIKVRRGVLQRAKPS